MNDLLAVVWDPVLTSISCLAVQDLGLEGDLLKVTTGRPACWVQVLMAEENDWVIAGSAGGQLPSCQLESVTTV